METSKLDKIWQASLSWWKSGTEKRPKIPPELLTESVRKPLFVNGNPITDYGSLITEMLTLSRTKLAAFLACQRRFQPGLDDFQRVRVQDLVDVGGRTRSLTDRRCDDSGTERP